MKRVFFALALLIGVSSCSSCESCKGSSVAPEGGTTPTTDAAALPVPTTSETAAPKPSAEPMEPNYSCRVIARAITTKACACPQKNKMGCCLFGMQPVGKGVAGPTPYVSCSGGKTDWPADVEAQLCKVSEEKKDLLAGCLAAKEKLQCGRSEKGDLGVLVPYECETLLKEALTQKK